jgi:hypothetical protein
VLFVITGNTLRIGPTAEQLFSSSNLTSSQLESNHEEKIILSSEKWDKIAIAKLNMPLGPF